jgi:uncharacterized caspase-like protein
MAGARLALVVANENYADNGLRRLAAPGRDADALAEILGDTAVGGFAVQVLRNESAHQIRVAIEDFFADRSPSDLLLVHFSCHGVKNAAGELFLAAADTRPTRLASTAIAADFVNRQMADSRAQRIALFLDCCYGGAFPRGMVVRAAQRLRCATRLSSSKISVVGAAAWSSRPRARCSTRSRVKSSPRTPTSVRRCSPKRSLTA